MIIQSILIDRQYATLDAAKKYVKDNFKLKKVDITDNYFRFRQKTPNPFMTYRTIELSPGVKAIIEK
jgi:hypothetical protein